LAIISSFSIRVLVLNSPYLGGKMAFLSRSDESTEIIGHNHQKEVKNRQATPAWDKESSQRSIE